MPKITKPKTYADYKTAKTRTKLYKINDGNGLSLYVRPSGQKSWFFDYSFGGKRSSIKIGYFDTMSLRDARQKRDELRMRLLEGQSPKASSDQEGVLTFKHITEEWLSKQQWVDGHLKRIRGFFCNHIFPNIGSLAIDEVTGKNIMDIANRLIDQNKANSAKDAIQRCGAVFEYAIDMDFCNMNPARNRGQSIKRPSVNHRPSLRKEQIPKFLEKLQNYKGREFIQLGLFLMMSTFVRPSELRCATWDEFDLNKAEWSIPKERMKMKRDHIVPLSKQVLSALKRLQSVTRGSDYLFPSINSAHKPISDVTFLKALKIMGYIGDKKIVPHGFRHTASTILHEQGFDSLHIERQLAHVDKNKIRGTYNSADYLPQRREMMQWYSDFIGK
jgi:integrase